MAQIPDRTVLKRPSIFDILQQSKRDFVGKDVQQSTTYTYVWSADQGGHFMLGFVPAFIIHWIGIFVHDELYCENVFGRRPFGIVWAAGLVMIGWTALELYDLFDSWRMAHKGSGYFSFNLGNLIWNVLTALFYFALGAVVAALSAWGAANVLLGILILGLLQFFFIGVWWLRRKIFFQQAGLPYLYRLANFSSTIETAGMDDDEKKKERAKLIEFIDGLASAPKDRSGTHEIDPNKGLPRRHLIITGSRGAGKSGLAAGIGTEFAFNCGIGRYTTMSELVQYVQNPTISALQPREPNQRPLPKAEDQEFNDGRILWKWPSVDLLIIDDIVELVLPLRRMFEAKVNSGDFRADIQKKLDDDTELQKLFGEGTDKQAIVNHITDRLQEELKAVARPETFAEYLVREYREVLDALRKIPHIVWVVGNTIRGDLFVDFVRKEFGFEPDDSNLVIVSLLPKTAPTANTRYY